MWHNRNHVHKSSFTREAGWEEWVKESKKRGENNFKHIYCQRRGIKWSSKKVHAI